MRNLKVYEAFGDSKANPERVQYFIERVGPNYRIFALTPVMVENGIEPEDCEKVFGKGTAWKDYSTYGEAKNFIDALEKKDIFSDDFEGPELED